MKMIKNDGFDVLRVKYNEQSTVIRHLYVKRFSLQLQKLMKNQIKDDEDVINRTLYIINIPPFVNENHLKYSFRQCGQILHVFFESKPSFATTTMMMKKLKQLNNKQEEFLPSNKQMGYKIGFIVFNNLNGIKKALEMIESNECFTLGSSNDNNVIKSWQLNYNQSIEQQQLLVKQATDFMENYSNIIEEQNEQKQDDDGWIQVNRQQRRDRHKALFNNQQNDSKILQKYQDRHEKRRIDEQLFDEQLAPLIDAALKKKRKNRRTMYDNF